MTMTTSVLSDSLQSLVDARLDTLDRMLLGRVPRRDRQAIVDEVESQIFDLLQNRGDNPSRADVLAVLAQLDPPEAYLREPEDGEAREPSVSRRESARGPSEPAVSSVVRLARWGGILGIVNVAACLLFPVYYFVVLMVATAVDEEVLAIVALCLAPVTILVSSILGLILAIRSRFVNNWSFAGLVLNVMALTGVLVGSAGILLMMMMSG